MARRKRKDTINPRFNKFNIGDWLESAGFEAFPTDREDLEWIWSRAIPEANNRLRRLESYKKSEGLRRPTFAYEEAKSNIKNLRGSGRFRRFNAKEIPDDYSQLEKEVKAALKFLNSQTSTPEGYEAWLENLKESLSQSFDVTNFDKDDFRAFGDIMRNHEYQMAADLLSSHQVVDLVVNYIHHLGPVLIEKIIKDYLEHGKEIGYNYLAYKFDNPFASSEDIKEVLR